MTLLVTHDGTVEEIKVQIGDGVKKGDVLFVIDPRWQQAALDQREAELVQAQVRLDNMKREADRTAQLLASKAISTEEADARQARFNEAITDALRPGHVDTHHPGEAVVRMADVVVINKIDTADLDHITRVRDSIMKVNPGATVVEAASPIFVDDPAAITALMTGRAYRKSAEVAKRMGPYAGYQPNAAAMVAWPLRPAACAALMKSLRRRDLSLADRRPL